MFNKRIKYLKLRILLLLYNLQYYYYYYYGNAGTFAKIKKKRKNYLANYFVFYFELIRI